MAEGRGLLKRFRSKSKKRKKDRFRDLRNAYRSIENPKKYLRTILFPLIMLGFLVVFIPSILGFFGLPVVTGQIQFALIGTVPMLLGVLYPYISWKNKEVDINEKMHFFITHLRVLAISDMSLKDIINALGGKTIYGNLGEEIRRISVLSTQWKTPLERAFHFISQRTPSKILKDFLDRSSQSLASGVNHRDFIEAEQVGVIEEYKTMYESSNEVIVVLNEIYVAMITSIVFVMVFGIIAPVVAGGDFTTYLYSTSFILIAAEGCILYFIYSFIPKDDIWHKSAKKSDKEKKINWVFRITLILVFAIGALLYIARYFLRIPLVRVIPFEILVAISFTPLIIPGILVLFEEEEISRREKNFIGFLPSLGAIAAMRGGRVTQAVEYLSGKDYGVLTDSVQSLHKRLKTTINDTASWEWFGVETHSNFIQRFSEMFREATKAAANPRKAAGMITENMRKIKNLRFKKLTILKTTNALFYGMTIGIAVTIYVTLVISRHMNMMTAGIGNPLADVGVDLVILQAIPERTISSAFIIIFFVLVVHCFIIAYTMKVLRGGHKFLTFFNFVLLVWSVAAIAVGIEYGMSQFLGM
jgi:flagellar protein FlaJ